MIAALIRWSLKNRSYVLLATVFIVVAGLYAMTHTAVDAIPDLSDVQVIIKTPFPGQISKRPPPRATATLSLSPVRIKAELGMNTIWGRGAARMAM